MLDFLTFLRENPYPGRGILVGKGRVYYFIMGRSANSRNRVFVKTEDGIRTEAYDPALLTDPSLIIYHPVRRMGDALVVTNGDQTDTICQYGDFRKGLMTRFGMDVVLAHPEGYDVMPEVEEIAKKNAAATGGSYRKVATMEEAFDGADIVYPKSWAPFAAMEQRTKLHSAGDQAGIDALEQQLLAQNAQFKNWTCSEDMMKRTRDGKALYLHCLPADITGVSCKEGEVDASVFDRYLVSLYKQASFKPYIIAAMILMSQVKDPVNCLRALDAAGDSRKWF